MKNYLVIFSVLLFGVAISCKKSSSPTPPPASDVNLKNGLLVYLPFDGNFADSSGNGNTVTPVAGASLTYDEHGNANSAFGGTGNGERLLVTNNGSIKFDTTFTLSFDVMARDTRREGLIEMVDNTTAESYSFGIATSSLPPYNVESVVWDSAASCNSLATATNSTGDSSTLVMASESWYNVILLYRKGTSQIYINGILNATRTGRDSTVQICPSAKIIIGAWWDQDPASINGKMDNVRLYNRVLNADEIAELAKDYQQD
jgi:Concanavalin A-like lectin/glucanases superfamily